MNAIILAGGKSSRYGKNKALINFNGITLIEKIVKGLKPLSKIYVVGSSKTDYTFLEEKVSILEDIFPDKGPLGGIYTGLKHSDSQYNLIIGCDMPNLNYQYYNLLLEQKKDYDVLVPQYGGYLEPLAGVYSRTCLTPIKESLESNQLRIISFYHKVKVNILDEEMIQEIAKPTRLFFNINYKKDAVTARNRFNRSEKTDETMPEK
jgi:molybdopterin-guanine dinucleotide biosynthesis protein A